MKYKNQNLLLKRNISIFFRDGILFEVKEFCCDQLNIEGEIHSAIDHDTTRSAWKYATGDLGMMTTLTRMGV